MTEVVLFHHVQGLTDGVRAFSDALSAGGPLTGEWSFGPWPDGVAVQIHGMDQDPFFALEGDVDAARNIVDVVGSDLAELFVYRGDAHLFTDRSLPSYDQEATALVLQRSRAFLDRLGD